MLTSQRIIVLCLETMRCYNCKDGDFDNCPAPSFGYCPRVAGPASCPDKKSVCYLTTTWSRTESSAVEFTKTCGVKEKRDCRSTECSCFCLRNQYTDTAESTSKNLAQNFEVAFTSFLKADARTHAHRRPGPSCSVLFYATAQTVTPTSC